MMITLDSGAMQILQKVLERCTAAGVTEVVLKRGPQPVALGFRSAQGKFLTDEVAVPKVADVIDTTAAGDSFNAGYLYARTQAKTPTEAAQYGSRCASIVIRHRGAIVERDIFWPNWHRLKFINVDLAVLREKILRHLFKRLKKAIFGMLASEFE